MPLSFSAAFCFQGGEGSQNIGMSGRNQKHVIEIFREMVDDETVADKIASRFWRFDLRSLPPQSAQEARVEG